MTKMSRAASRKFKWGIAEAVVAGSTREPPVSCGCRIVARIAAFPILADPVDVKKGDQLCETVSQPSIRPDKVDPPMGS